MLTLLVLSGLLQASDPPSEADVEALEQEAESILEEAAERQERADALAVEIATLRARLVAAANRVRDSEAAADEAEAELARLEIEEASTLSRLADERDNLARVLAALQRMEESSPPALAVNPNDAAEAARAAGLMARLAPELNERARILSMELRALEQVRTELRTQRINVADAQAELEETRDEVEALVAERQNAERALRSQSDDLSRQAAAIASQAGSLRELMDDINAYAAIEPRLSPVRTGDFTPSDVTDGVGAVGTTSTLDTGETTITSVNGDPVPVPRLRPGRRAGGSRTAIASAATPTADIVEAVEVSEGDLLDAIPVTGDLNGMTFAQMQGQLRPPVTGRISAGFQEIAHDGQRRDGIWMQTRSRAQVTAPFDGIVVYAGDFQSLESVLLINTRDGYTLVIGGMALIYANEGQSVLAGEPVGAMPERDNPPPRLYFGILRSSNQAEDPEAWFRPEFRRDQ